MTWTLRFYDSVDVEIGWVRTDPYEYEITHPGDMSDVADLLESYESPMELENDQSEIDVEGFESWSPTLYSFPAIEGPVEHIEYIRDNLSHEKIDSRELNDE